MMNYLGGVGIYERGRGRTEWSAKTRRRRLRQEWMRGVKMDNEKLLYDISFYIKNTL
jgi:hypothetical protein